MFDAAPALTRRLLLTAGLAVAVAAPLAAPLAAQETREVLEMSMGAADAPVTLIEYASLTCPHCAAFANDVLPLLKTNYIDTGQVRLVYREVYFDRPGLWAAMVARCAGQDRYFGVVDLFYRDQAAWSQASDAVGVVEGLKGIGRQAGMSDEAVDACLADGKFAEALVADFQKNVTADGIESTPTFLLDGEKVSNLPWPELEAKIKEKLGS